MTAPSMKHKQIRPSVICRMKAVAPTTAPSL